MKWILHFLKAEFKPETIFFTVLTFYIYNSSLELANIFDEPYYNNRIVSSRMFTCFIRRLRLLDIQFEYLQ